ncbi:hypothetical protein AB0A63_32405 [Lentzea sp. NPDC042327]|uniref:hypothetical protein n=1 Tax=Lentzea sp. NPDC042327 TaxID=3154801 RepID=UPI0033D2EA11
MSNRVTTLRECLEPGSLWQPVLQLTIVTDIDGEPHVLNGTRRASANRTHPNVVSTPTSMLPVPLASAILDDSKGSLEEELPLLLDEVRSDDLRVVARYAENDVRPVPRTAEALPYAVADLLARKLGCGTALEHATAEEPLATCSLSMVGGGFSYAADGDLDEDGLAEPLFEPLLMFGVVVRWQDPAVFPERTESYDGIVWTRLPDYQEGVRTKRIEAFNPKFAEPDYIADADEISVCVRGLCLQTANIIIESGTVDHRTVS